MSWIYFETEVFSAKINHFLTQEIYFYLGCLETNDGSNLDHSPRQNTLEHGREENDWQ